jgi:hypothetical protein
MPRKALNTPATKGESLSADEVYAVTAFLLYANGIIQENDVMDPKSLPKVEMPNRRGYVPAEPVMRKPGPFGIYR